MITETIIASGIGVTYDDGNARAAYRVLATGEVQDGAARWSDGQWSEPTTWTTWDAAQIIRTSKSSGTKESDWFGGLSAAVRQTIREHYGLVGGGSYPCAGHKDGCGKRVSKAGTYCASCEHDA